MHLIEQHPAVCVFIGFWLFSAFAGGMPSPTDRSGVAYIWLHNSLQLAAGNLSKAIAVRYPTLAELSVCPNLQANAAGTLGEVFLFASTNHGFLLGKLIALRNFFADRFPLRSPAREFVSVQPLLEQAAALIIAQRQPAPRSITMGIFLTVLQYAFALLPSIVTGVQTLVGDTQSGATKKQMATDMLSQALTGATAVTGGTNSALASLAATAALGIINATDAISTAVTHTKATGAYTLATKASVANTDAIAKAALPTVVVA